MKRIIRSLRNNYILVLMIAVLALTGCGAGATFVGGQAKPGKSGNAVKPSNSASPDNPSSLDNKSGKDIQGDSESTTPVTVTWDDLVRYDMPVGDFTFGAGNDSFRMDDTIDPTCALYDLNANPMATDAVIDGYVTELLNMEDMLLSKPAYVEYMKEHNPYFVNIFCHGEQIMTVPLDGNQKSGQDDLKTGLKRTIAPIASSFQQEREEFREKLSTYEYLQWGEDGRAFMTVDETQVTVSLDNIMRYVMELNALDPVTREEASHYVGSERLMNELIDGDFDLYLQAADGSRRKLTEDGLFGGIQFSDPPEWTASQVYEALVPVDEIKDGTGNLFPIWFQLKVEEDGSWEASASIQLRDSEEEYSREQVVEALYTFYRQVHEPYAAYGITEPEEVQLNGTVRVKDGADAGASEDSGNSDGASDEMPTTLGAALPLLDIRVTIPVAQELTREEFESVIADGLREVAESYYEEG